MADEEEDEDDLEFEPADAGTLFRAEMWATNMLMGYWKHGLTILIVVLLSVLFYGSYRTHVLSVQRMAAADIAEVERSFDVPIWAMASVMADGGENAPTREELAEAAEKIATVGRANSGAGAVEASLKAAELFRLAGRVDERRAALEHASAHGQRGALKYAADAGLANLDLEIGQGEAAVNRFRALKDASSGFLVEQATMDLALALEHLDRKDEARSLYAEFLETWPDSKRADEVRIRQERLDASPAAPAPAPAPEPTEEEGQGSDAPEDAAPEEAAPEPAQE